MSRPGKVDLYKKMISKIELFERGSRILESRNAGLGEESAQIPESGPESAQARKYQFV